MSYEVCLFSIIKNIVNIYMNCTTYIQIHTVLYSKFLLCVVSCSTRSSTSDLETVMLTTLRCFHWRCFVLMGDYCLWDGGRCGHALVTSHSCEAEDFSQETFIGVKINYDTKEYDETSCAVIYYKVHIGSMCKHVGGGGDVAVSSWVLVHHPHVARRYEGHDMVVSSEVDLRTVLLTMK